MEDSLRLLEVTWANKSLADLRAESLAEPRGMVYETLRAGPGNGRRVVIVACATGADWLVALPKIFDFDPAGTVGPWEELTLCAAVRRIGINGLGYEECLDEAGNRLAIVLIATEPRSIEMLERILGLI